MDAVQLGFPYGYQHGYCKGIAFYGPYMVVDGPNGDVSGAFSKAQVECTLRLTVNSEGRDESPSTVNAPSRLRRSLSLCFPFRGPHPTGPRMKIKTKPTVLLSDARGSGLVLPRPRA